MHEMDPAPQQLTDSNLYATLVQSGVPEDVSEYAAFLESEGYITADDVVNQRVVDELKTATQDVMAQVTQECQNADLTKMKNKSAYLIGIIKTQKKKLNTQTGEVESEQHPFAAFAASLPLKKIMYAPFPDDVKPSEDAIRALIGRTGYDITVTSGQRKYGPPPNWEDEEPPAGCEVFIGGLKHRGNFEDVLVPWLEPCGQIYELRMMTCQYGGTGKGFAFCVFADKESANRCVAMRNQVVLPGNQKPLEVKLHNPNTRLYVARLDKARSKDQIITELTQHGDGITDLILKMAEDGRTHRGFGFVDYRTHKQASAAKRNLENGGLVFGKTVAVSWAEPISEVSAEEMAKVKTLYVTGLKSGMVSSESLNDRFSPYGDISSLKVIKDYAFIEYKERSAAIEAMNDLNDTSVEGCTISVVLATPHKNKGPGNQRGGGGFGPPRGGGFGAPRGGFGGPLRGRGGPPVRGGRGGFMGGNGFGSPPARGGFGDRGRGFSPRGRGGFAERGRGGFPPSRGGFPPVRGSPQGAMSRGARGLPRGSPRGSPRGAMGGGFAVRGSPRGVPRGGAYGAPRGAPRGSPRGARGAPRGGARGGFAGNGAMAEEYGTYGQAAAEPAGYGAAAGGYEEDSYAEQTTGGTDGGYESYGAAYSEPQYDSYGQSDAAAGYGARKRPQQAGGDVPEWGGAKRARGGAAGATRTRYAAAAPYSSTPQAAANGKAWYEDDVW